MSNPLSRLSYVLTQPMKRESSPLYISSVVDTTDCGQETKEKWSSTAIQNDSCEYCRVYVNTKRERSSGAAVLSYDSAPVDHNVPNNKDFQNCPRVKYNSAVVGSEFSLKSVGLELPSSLVGREVSLI